MLTPCEFVSFNDLVGCRVMAAVKMGTVICCAVILYFSAADGYF